MIEFWDTGYDYPVGSAALAIFSNEGGFGYGMLGGYRGDGESADYTMFPWEWGVLPSELFP